MSPKALLQVLTQLVVILLCLPNLNAQQFVEPKKPSAHIVSVLDKPFSYQCNSQPLAKVIQEVMLKTSLPIVVGGDAKAKTQTSITIELPEMPLASALQVILAEVGLNYLIDGSVVKVYVDPWLGPDDVETTEWANGEAEAIQRAERVLATPVSGNVTDLPLNELIMSLSQHLHSEIALDERELKAIDVLPDVRVSFKATNEPLRLALATVLDDLDLQITVLHGKLTVTSSDKVDDNPIARIYWLDKPSGNRMDVDTIMNALRTSIEPDTWVDNGGSSTMEPVFGLRLGLCVATSLETHRQIEALLRSLGCI